VVGGLRERWRVTVADGLAVLTDTVDVPPASAPGVVAVAGCGP
jgi:hypothetical protein